MKTKGYILLLICAVCLSSLAEAQKGFEVYGAGRFRLLSGNVSGNQYEGGVFSGDTLAPDTINPGREMRGTALFDLGFKFNPNAQTEIRVLTRVTSDLDGFWGEGIGFGFRELYIRGLVRNVVRYRVGDLDLKMSPFTLYNNHADLGNFRLSPLHVYEDIVQYEQFYRNNRWRQQGVQTDFKLILPGKGNSLSFDAFLAKNRQTDFFFLPDRLLGGGNATFGKKGIGEVGYNFISLFEIAETAQFSEAQTSTAVHTIEARVQPLKDLPYIFYGEGGLSSTSYEEVNAAPRDTSDFFFQVGVRDMSREHLRFFGEYIMVNPGFRSPGAQSRRLNAGALPLNFSYQGNAEVPRPINAFDVLIDPTIYNITISPNLQEFLPAYNNVDPYGIATPNRQGFRLGGEYMNDSCVVRWLEAEAQLLTEVQGEGIEEYRNFMKFRLNGRFGMNDLYGGEEELLLELSASYQSTQRDELQTAIPELQGIGAVDLTGYRVQSSLSFEIAPDLYLQGGVFLVEASGQEYLAERSAFSEITDYRRVDIDLTDQTVFGGVKYTFNENTHLLAQARRSEVSPNDDPSNDYRMDQFTVLFNIFF